jgi:hypothetical protein
MPPPPTPTPSPAFKPFTKVSTEADDFFFIYISRTDEGRVKPYRVEKDKIMPHKKQNLPY